MTDPGTGRPDEEELRRRFEEELRRIRVEDVIVQTAVTLVNLAGRRLGLTGDASERDLDQAKTAIEGARALHPLLPADAQEAVRDALSQLQIAFAREARGAQEPPAGGQPGGAGGQPGGAGGQPGGAGEGEPSKPHGDPLGDEAERAKARSKIWTPPGTGS